MSLLAYNVSYSYCHPNHPLYIVQVEITSISSNANTLVNGSNYTVNCTYVSNPPPNVTWTHNGTVLESNEYITINTQSTYSELIISPLQGLQNSGNYFCIAQNILGNDSSTVSLTVQGKLINININCVNYIMCNQVFLFMLIS